MSTHQAEVNEALDRARNRCLKLIRDAERRGDQEGADAWLVALRSIESAEKAMRDAREAQTWRDAPPISPLIMPCGCPFGSHPAKPNYLQGAAEREGPVCDLGWPNAPASVMQHEAPESPETDQAHAVDLAKRIAGRSGSKWHDIDQRLARSVIRTCNDLRVVTRERTVERERANEFLTQLHDANKEREAWKKLKKAEAARARQALVVASWEPRVVVGPTKLKITDGDTDETIDCNYLIINPRQAREIAAQLQAGADRLDPPAGVRCHLCDRQLATHDDYESHPENCEHCQTLCWSEYHSGCVAPRVDWRARALAAEAQEHLGSGIKDPD